MASCAIPSLFLLVLCLSFAASSAHAAPCTLISATTWNIAGNGTWSTNGDWNPAAFPNSSSTNTCITNGSSTVTLDINASVADLQLASGNGLVVSNGNSLTVNGSDIVNAGNISIDSTGSFTDLIINPTSGTLTLSGGGTLSLSNSFNNRVYSTGGGADSLVNDVNHTIQASGQFGINNAGFAFTLTNKGTIDANLNAST